MKVALCGGGTGGHVYPALALQQAFEREFPEVEVLFLGARRGVEAEILAHYQKSFIALPAQPLASRTIFSPRTPLALLVTAQSTLRAARILRREKVDVVIGTGGYASACVIVAGCLLSLPTILFEANTVPGRVNKALARWASAVTVGFEEAAEHLPAGKTFYTGTPVRREFLEIERKRARKELGLHEEQVMLLVFGGSQGAMRINDSVADAVPQLLSHEERLIIYHLCGIWKAALDKPLAVQRQVGEGRYRVMKVAMEQMPRLIAAADLSLCRAGSSSIAELLVAGVPSILVPYPHATGDHQSKNAQSVAKAGAAIVIDDSELNGKKVQEEVIKLLRKTEQLQSMRQAALAIAKPNAAHEIAELAISLREGAG